MENRGHYRQDRSRIKVGKNLQAIREEKDLSMEFIARELGMELDAYSGGWWFPGGFISVRAHLALFCWDAAFWCWSVPSARCNSFASWRRVCCSP